MGKYYNYILDICKDKKPDEICCKKNLIENKLRLYGTESMLYNFELRNLIGNNIIGEDEVFLFLTKKGYKFLHSGEKECLTIDFRILIQLSKNKEDLFVNLWNLIGPVGQAPYYISGSVYFNAIAPFLGLAGSYTRYTEKLKSREDGMIKRIDWYEELYNQLPDDAIEPFLKKLSDSFNNIPSEDTIEQDETSIEISIPELASVEKVSEKTKSSNMSKPNKIFISHCGKDKKSVEALVGLIGEIININKDNLFCSCIPGFDVMVGDSFMSTIKQQYNDYNLFMIYVISDSYMKSYICMNEMGASWMTKTDEVGILLPSVGVADLGNCCLDKNKVAVVFDADDLTHRLNQLREKIQSLFPDNIKEGGNMSYWELKRDRFIEEVKAAYQK